MTRYACRAGVMAVALLLSACSATTDSVPDEQTTGSSAVTTSEITPTAPLSIDDVRTTVKDPHEVDPVNDPDVTITFGEDETGDGYEINGNLTTITGAGTYLLTGTYEGTITVDVGDSNKVVLVMEGLDVTAIDGPALQVAETDEVTIVLESGTQNILRDSETYSDVSEGAANAALYSTSDLSVTGTGALTVEGNNNDGIASTDGLVLESGTLVVNAVDDGVRGKDYLVIAGSDLAVTAGGHALKADNIDDETVGYVLMLGSSHTLTAGEDGINAQTVMIGHSTMMVDAGDDGIHAGGSLIIDTDNLTIAHSTEGIEGSVVSILGGTIDVTASDGGINGSTGDGSSANPNAVSDGVEILVAGGTLTIDSGADGIDSNGVIAITGGHTTINGPVSGPESAIDSSSTIMISGGVLYGGGTAGLGETPDPSSPQGWIYATINAEAGKTVAVLDEDGQERGTYTPTKDAQTVMISLPEITNGETYRVTVDGQDAATVTSGEGGSGMLGGSGRPDMPGGGEVPIPDGDFPEGEWPEPPSGDFPEMPEGGMPQMPDGDMPDGELPDGQWPDDRGAPPGWDDTDGDETGGTETGAAEITN